MELVLRIDTGIFNQLWTCLQSLRDNARKKNLHETQCKPKQKSSTERLFASTMTPKAVVAERHVSCTRLTDSKSA